MEPGPSFNPISSHKGSFPTALRVYQSCLHATCRQTLKCHNATNTSVSFQRNRSWRRNFPPDSHLAILFTFCTLLSQIVPRLEGTSSHFELHTESQNSLSRIHMMCYFPSTVYFNHNPAEQAVE